VTSTEVRIQDFRLIIIYYIVPITNVYYNSTFISPLTIRNILNIILLYLLISILNYQYENIARLFLGFCHKDTSINTIS